MNNLFSIAKMCLDEADPDRIVELTRQGAQAWQAGEMEWQQGDPVEPITDPGRPDKPTLVSPGKVPFRGVGTREDRAALIHALTHIEFNAIGLAWDAVYRYRDMPKDYYDDWVQVAVDEALHFELLRERLREYDAEYGDFDAHNGLWEMAQKTADDLVARMALVPRVLEARSLDVTPAIIERFKSVGDPKTADVITLIERDEVAHVAAGSRWFHYCCEQRGLDAQPTFQKLVDTYMKGRLKKPFNADARRRSGFTEAELEGLMELLS